MVSLISFLWSRPVQGAIRGICSDCHTMHNSQGNTSMNFDGNTEPNENLTRGTCYGCHAQGGSSPVVALGTSRIPQVMHSGATDLAGGNFGYITGMKGSGAADSKGHNIGDLTGIDAVLYAPPGGIVNVGGPSHVTGRNVNTENLSCAGVNGCHGYRHFGSGGAYPKGISGAHHRNVDGQVDQATEPANSYRFLMAVKGFESSDWEENPSPANHNEYFALSQPVQLGCSGSAVKCHSGPGGLTQPPDGTMSQFCATCHGNFHTVATSESDGIGSSANSPFIRHPTDLSLPASGEYAAYTVYNLSAPVARLTVPASSSSTVTPGSDAVMCLSCHVAHASDYPDMLRWDYTSMVAGSSAGNGCFVCHSTKN
ncbi:cytochrome c3 family protein [Desulfolithobacter sp.]